MEADIYLMDLHDELIISKTETVLVTIVRVPGGWLYARQEYIQSENDWQTTSETFVPYNDEFDK